MDDRSQNRGVTDDHQAGEQRNPTDRGGAAMNKNRGATDGLPAGEQRKPIDRGGAAMNKKKVGGRLLQLRGMRSQEEVAAALGIRQSTLAMYERGSRMPRDEIKLALAHYYGCSVESLFFSENDTFRGISR